MIVTKPVASLTLTRLPGVTRIAPTRPAIGASSLAYPSFNRSACRNRLVRFDRLLSRLEDCGRLIELLARSNVLLDKLLFAPQVGLGLRKSCVVLRKLCLVTGESMPGSRDHPG